MKIFYSQSTISRSIFCLAASLFFAACGSDTSPDDDHQLPLESCGSNFVENGETCDGHALNGATGQSLGFDMGTLACASSCLEYDTSSCFMADACTPTTCDDAQAECGVVDDGCGGTLYCGGCEGNLNCGEPERPNICVATCQPGCPEGFECNPDGVCTGDADTIIANMPTAQVTLVPRVNGHAPSPTDECNNADYKKAEVGLHSRSSGEARFYKLFCGEDSQTVTVPQDTYRVGVAGMSSSDMPAIFSETHASFLVDADTTIVADMTTVSVRLVVQHDGRAPEPHWGCAIGTPRLAQMMLRNLATGEFEIYDIPCDASPVDIVIPTGTYSVSVKTYFAENIAELPIQTHASITIDADTTLTANIRTAQVSLVAQVDGHTPEPTESCGESNEDLAIIRLESLSDDNIYTYRMPCDGSPRDIIIPQDTYRVWVRGTDAIDMPNRYFETHASFVVDANTTLTANMPTAQVNLIAQVNGSTPEPPENCTTLGQITLRNQTTDLGASYEIPCDGSPLQVRVPQDTYDVSVTGTSESHLLSQWDFQTHQSLVVDADTTITANMPTARVSLVAQIDGRAPEATSACDDYDGSAQITLRGQRSRVEKKVVIPCDASPVELIIPQDSYSVLVAGVIFYPQSGPELYSDMLPWTYQTHASLVVDADTTITADMPTRTVNLVAQVDGRVPEPSRPCPGEERNIAQITLRSLSSENTSHYRTPCDGSPMEVRVPTDIYSVSVQGDNADDMPDWEDRAIQQIEIK